MPDLSIPDAWKAQPPRLAPLTADAAARQVEREQLVVEVEALAAEIAAAEAAQTPVNPPRDPLAVVIGRNLSTAPYRSVADHADTLARIVREHIEHEGATS